MRFFLLVLVSSVSYLECSKILGIFPIPAKSMNILGQSLMRGLAEKGHEVTFITAFPEKNPEKLEYNEVVLTGFLEDLQSNYENLFEHVSSSVFHHMLFVKNWGLKLSRQVFEHENFKRLIVSNETFDVVIVEQFFVDSLKGLSWHYNAHLVVFSTVGANTWFNGLMGNPSPPSYIPEILSDFSDDMNFFERFWNSIYRSYIEVILNFSYYPEQNKILHKYLPEAPHLNEIIHNNSLALINSDISLNQPVPKVPNMIDIGGFHIKTARSGISDVNLMEYLNRDVDENGFIYFSMGSNLKSSFLPKETIGMLLRVFSKLKQKILWKYEKELNDKPDNVKTKKWLPQQELLGHPKLKLFITHGGLLSSTESIYHGVPMLVIPVFGDQRLNAARIVQKGFGLSIWYTNLTEKYFEECLTELLNNGRYAEKAKELSKIFHDKPMKPMETAIFWIEYVIRHKGATHLRVAATKLNIFQYFLFDIVFSIVVISFFSIYFLNLAWRRSFRGEKSKKD